jgi:hypothetical protein
MENSIYKLKLFAKIGCFVRIARGLLSAYYMMYTDFIASLRIMVITCCVSWIVCSLIHDLADALGKALEDASYARSNLLSNEDRELLNRLKEQYRRERAQEEAAALQSKLADSGCENRAKSFMEAISDCESISQVKKIWDAFPKDEADALTQEIEKKISSAFQIERMYGSSNDSVEKLKESIVSLQ